MKLTIFFSLAAVVPFLVQGKKREKSAKTLRISLAFPPQLESDLGRPSLIRSYNFTVAQQRKIIRAHNRLRAGEPAANMQEMVWDPRLAELASEWAHRCVALHRTGMDRSLRFNYDFVGENIWWSNEETHLHDLGKVVDDFFSEKKYYTFRTRRCDRGRICGHYTQVVWANSCAVGCSAVNCGKIKYGLGINKGHIIVCNYGPGGNKLGERPYVRGRRCSGCSGSCTRDGLCGCVDKHLRCRFWASIGECQKNPKFMNAFCGSSCRLCR